ncbi:MAG: hypothetical protein HC841_00060 [Verrucomicrobiae bacterium]|nr:hypothetical protein [Verrucomicrobiae bacterium]
MNEELKPTDLDKFHEDKAREMFQRYLDKVKVETFLTPELAFVAGFCRGVDYGKATYSKKEEYR